MAILVMFIPYNLENGNCSTT